MKAIILATIAIFFTGICHGENLLYRFKNDKGQTEIRHNIPPGMERNGYDIINGAGQLIKTVAPISEEDASVNEARLRSLAQQQKDKALLRMYSGSTDAIRARDRQTDALQLKAQYIITSNATAAKKSQDLLQRAADIERTGNKVNDALSAEIKALQNQIAAATQEAAQLEKEEKEISLSFEPIIERLNQIAEEKAAEKEKAGRNQ